jgi:hypothetical protein
MARSMISTRATACSATLCCLLVFGFVAACGDSTPSPIEPPDASVPVACDSAGVALCGDSCVNTESNPAHCGGCGKACATGEACAGGACVALCRINGEQVATGTVNAENSCEQCVPATSMTTWTQRADGTPCNPRQVCSAGACGPHCFIEGVLYAVGAPNPANACEVCVPATSTTQWTARASVPLLVGGDDIEAQGWKANSFSTPSALTYGADHVRLATSTTSGGSTSGQLLIVRANAFDPTKPFTLHVTALVESVNPHNTLDSGAALLGSLTGQAGTSAERAQMIYLDSAAIGWADDTQSAAFPVTDGAYHVYELAVDAAKVATVSIDGVAKLKRNNFTSNGTLAIGDQTNDPSVDGVMRIKSVERLCP